MTQKIPAAVISFSPRATEFVLDAAGFAANLNQSESDSMHALVSFPAWSLNRGISADVQTSVRIDGGIRASFGVIEKQNLGDVVLSNVDGTPLAIRLDSRFENAALIHFDYDEELFARVEPAGAYISPSASSLAQFKEALGLS